MIHPPVARIPFRRHVHRLLRMALAFVFFVPAVHGQVLPLGDLNTEVNSLGNSRPEQFVALGPWTLFTATDHDHGEELWRTDGTSAGTTLVADIRPGLQSSNPGAFVLFDGLAYFAAADGSVGRELWRTDGTPGGTERVADLAPGPDSSSPRSFAVVGSRLYFVATTPTAGVELWKFDAGGAATMVVDLVPGVGSSSPSGLIAAGNRVAFSATTSAAGRELWLSAGTAGSTTLYDVEPGPSGSNPTALATADGQRLFFAATTATHGRELWVFYYVTTNTFGRLTDIMPGAGSSNPTSTAMLGNTLIFRVNTPGGVALWRSNATAPGTFELAAISALEPTPLGAEVLFVSGGDLWKTDGTIAGTGLVLDPGSSIYSFLSFTPYDGALFFVSPEGLWRTDGTAGGTELWDNCGVFDCDSIDDVGAGADAVYLSKFDPFAGYELWRAEAGSLDRLKDIHTDVGNSLPYEFTAFDDRLFFRASVDGAGAELLVWDGTAPEASLFEDLFPGEGGSYTGYLLATPNALFYLADEPATGNELRRIDPAATASELVVDLSPGSSNSNAVPVTPFAGGLLFMHRESGGPYQLWHTPGSGATQVTSFTEDAYGVDLSYGVAGLGGEVFFAADDDTVGNELWSCDTSGAGLVRDLELGPSSSNPRQFATLGGWVYFSAEVDGEWGLWRTDGSTQNTTLVRELPVVAYLHAVGSYLVFIGSDGTSGLEPWTSDGTFAGTQRLVDIAPGAANGIAANTSPSDLVESGGRLFFPAGSAATGTELWVTDGTPAGTELVSDLRPGPESSTPWFLIALPDGGVAFSAYEEGFGVELWRSDGTAAGTVRVTDISPGEASSEPIYPGLFGDWVVFMAYSGPTGSEPWAWRWNPDPAIFSDGFESGDTSAW